MKGYGLGKEGGILEELKRVNYLKNQRSTTLRLERDGVNSFWSVGPTQRRYREP